MRYIDLTMDVVRWLVAALFVGGMIAGMLSLPL